MPVTSTGSVVRGGLWSAASGIIPQAYAIIISVVAARFLGPEGMGRQSFIAFVALSVTLLFSGGLPVALMRHIGEEIGRGKPDPVRELIAWSWRIEAVAAAAGAGLLGAIALRGGEPHNAWLLAGVVAALGVLHNVPSALLMGAQRWRQAAIVGLVTGALATVATVTVLAAGGGITGMFAVEAVISLANLIWTTALARKTLLQVAPRRTPATALRRAVLRSTAITSVGVILTFIVWRRSELFFLERYSTDTEIALFSIAFAATTALFRLPEVFATVAIPTTATLFGEGATERIRTGFGRALRLLTLLTLPLTAAGMALGPATLELAYGSRYHKTGDVFLILLAPFPLVPLMNLSSAVLVGLGHLRLPLIGLAVAAAVNITLDALLIPRYDALGGAIANSSGQAAGALMLMLFVGRQVGRVEWNPFALLRGALAAAGCGSAAWTCVYFVGGFPGVALGVVAGTVAFLMLALLLRVLATEDAAWVSETAGDRFHGFLSKGARVAGWRRRDSGAASAQ